MNRSVLRKGNCFDNTVAANFFTLLKSEMYHGHYFDSAEQLMACIDEYIDYYNNDRIKVKLKGMIPVEYRNQALEVA
ncbi:IS3 family transposase [Pseudoalteromonas sp. B530]|uniref:IS3 family transposase n=1 Tax=Pseudoalteromonas sp. B530 TaxID=2994390 RepID=UPI002B05B564|nr:IS3 family transposase [Pseudoalteromonas sp. B530]